MVSPLFTKKPSSHIEPPRRTYFQMVLAAFGEPVHWNAISAPVPEYVLLKTFTGTDCSRKAIIWMHNRMTPDMYAEKVDADNMHTFWDPDIAKWVD